MAQDRMQLLDRILPPEGGSPRRAVWMSFGLWPVAVLILIHGIGWGLASLSMLILPVCLVAFRRIADLFPPATPARRVIVGFSIAYVVVTGWVLLAQSGAGGFAVSVVIVGATLRVLLRSTDEGVPTIEAMGDRAGLEWETEQALESGSPDDGPGDSGLGPLPRFHWPDV